MRKFVRRCGKDCALYYRVRRHVSARVHVQVNIPGAINVVAVECQLSIRAHVSAVCVRFRFIEMHVDAGQGNNLRCNGCSFSLNLVQRSHVHFAVVDIPGLKREVLPALRRRRLFLVDLRGALIGANLIRGLYLRIGKCFDHDGLSYGFELAPLRCTLVHVVHARRDILLLRGVAHVHDEGVGKLIIRHARRVSVVL